MSTYLGKVGEGSPLMHALFDGLRQLGLPVQQDPRSAYGTSQPWPLAVVVTNVNPAPDQLLAKTEPAVSGAGQHWRASGPGRTGPWVWMV